MESERKERYDLTEEASEREGPEATRIARQLESDDLYEGPGAAITPSPDGDATGENKVATSISDD